MFNIVWYNLCFSICVFPYSVDYKRNFDWQMKHSSVLLSFGSIPVGRPDLDFQDICIFSVNKSWSHICSIYRATRIIETLSVSFCSMLLTPAKLAASLELVSDYVYSKSVTLVWFVLLVPPFLCLPFMICFTLFWFCFDHIHALRRIWMQNA